MGRSFSPCITSGNPFLHPHLSWVRMPTLLYDDISQMSNTQRFRHAPSGLQQGSETPATTMASALRSHRAATLKGHCMTLPFRIHRRAAPVALAVAAVLGAQAAQAATWVYVANADSQDVSVLELDLSLIHI